MHQNHANDAPQATHRSKFNTSPQVGPPVTQPLTIGANVSPQDCNMTRGAPIIDQFADNRYRLFHNRHRPILGIGRFSASADYLF